MPSQPSLQSDGTDKPAGPLIGTPSPFYVAGDSSLRISSWGSLAGVELRLNSRELRIDGEISPGSERHVPSSNRAIATTEIPLTEGWLLGCTVFASVGTPRVGQVFVVVDVIRGSGAAATVLQTILQGYVTDTQRLTWPGSPIVSSIRGRGVIRSIAGTDPAANVEILETVPTNARWRLLSFMFTLVTDVNVANREVSLCFDDGAATTIRLPSGFVQAASLTEIYSASIAGPTLTGAAALVRNMTLPDVPLQGGMRIKTITTALQATDNYSAPQYTVEEWIED